MADKQKVRLSTVDLLPDEAEADVTWAVAEIEAGGRNLKDIHAEFNARLADRGIGSISASAFSRYALRKRKVFRKMRETLDVGSAIAAARQPGDDEGLTIALSQLIKTAAFEIVEAGSKLNSKSLMELARALHSADTALKSASQRKAQKDEAETKKTEAKIAKVAKEAGLSKQIIAQLRREFLGVRPKEAA